MTAQTATANEYLTVHVDKGLEPLHRDAYRNFGWVLESADERAPIRPLPLLPAIAPRSVALTFARDRALRDDAALRLLQREADAALGRIAALERSKRRVPAIVAGALGVVGAALLAVSVMLGAAGLLGIALGAGGLLVWAGAAVAYFALRSARTRRAEERIEAEVDAVFDSGQRASQRIG